MADRLSERLDGFISQTAKNVWFRIFIGSLIAAGFIVGFGANYKTWTAQPGDAARQGPGSTTVNPERSFPRNAEADSPEGDIGGLSPQRAAEGEPIHASTRAQSVPADTSSAETDGQRVPSEKDIAESPTPREVATPSRPDLIPPTPDSPATEVHAVPAPLPAPNWPAAGKDAWLNRDMPPHLIMRKDGSVLSRDTVRPKGYRISIKRVEAGAIFFSSVDSPIVEEGFLTRALFLEHFSEHPVPK